MSLAFFMSFSRSFHNKSPHDVTFKCGFTAITSTFDLEIAEVIPQDYSDLSTVSNAWQ